MQIFEMIVFFLVITGGFTLSGLIGFGANVLSMPVLSLFFDIQDLVVVLAVISFTNAAYRVVENRRGIIWNEFVQMLLFTLPGTLIGLWILKNLPEAYMKFALGCFVIAVASRNLYQRRQQRERQNKAEPAAAEPSEPLPETGKGKLFYRAVLFAGGIMQGAFVCGGPLYLIYCSHYYGKKRLQFRGMQFAIILVNSSFIFFSYLLRGAYTKPLILQSGLGLLGLLAAVLISNAWLKHIQDAALQQLVQVMLLIAGISLIVQTVF